MDSSLDQFGSCPDPVFPVCLQLEGEGSGGAQPLSADVPDDHPGMSADAPLCKVCGARAIQKSHCRKCWGATLGDSRRKYKWTSDLDGMLRAAYESPTKADMSQQLTRLSLRQGWPRHAFTDRAQALGLCWIRKKPWTPEELKALEMMAGEHSVKQIAKALGRSVRAVSSRAEEARWSLTVTDGYSAAELARFFGVDQHKIGKWIDRGFFGTRTKRGARVKESSVRNFIRVHFGEFDIRRVNQAWFISMMFSRSGPGDGDE